MHNGRLVLGLPCREGSSSNDRLGIVKSGGTPLTGCAGRGVQGSSLPLPTQPVSVWSGL